MYATDFIQFFQSRLVHKSEKTAIVSYFISGFLYAEVTVYISISIHILHLLTRGMQNGSEQKQAAIYPCCWFAFRCRSWHCTMTILGPSSKRRRR